LKTTKNEGKKQEEEAKEEEEEEEEEGGGGGRGRKEEEEGGVEGRRRRRGCKERNYIYFYREKKRFCCSDISQALPSRPSGTDIKKCRTFLSNTPSPNSTLSRTAFIFFNIPRNRPFVQVRAVLRRMSMEQY
jgi:hypothetical protein